MGEEVVGEGGGRLDDMLAVVQQEEHAAPGAVLGEPYEGVARALFGEGPQLLGACPAQHGVPGAERAQDGLGDGVRVVQGGQFRQPDAVGPGVGDGLRGLLRQPGLARAAGAEEGDEPGAGEVLAQGRDVAVPADEAGEPGAEVAGGGPGRLRGGGGLHGGGRLRGFGRGRFLVEEFAVQAAQFGPGVGAEAVGEYGADLLVRRQRLGRPSGVPQGPDAQGLERFVERVGGAERGQLPQGLVRPPEDAQRLQPGPAGAEPAGLQAGGGRGTVGQVVQRRPAPERQGRVEDGDGFDRVALLQGPAPLPRQPLEPVQVHGVRLGGQPVATLHRLDGTPPQRPPQPPDQCLERTGRVGGRVAVPHLAHQDPGRDGPPGVQGEDGEQGAQPRPAEGDGRTVVAECPGGAEDAVAHGPIVRDGRGHGVDRVELLPGSSSFPPCRRTCRRTYDGAAVSPRPTVPGVVPMTTAVTRGDRRISPVFLGIAAVTAVAGWAVWAGFAGATSFAVFLLSPGRGSSRSASTSTPTPVPPCTAGTSRWGRRAT